MWLRKKACIGTFAIGFWQKPKISSEGRRLYLIHIQECLDRIQKYLAGVDQAKFLDDSMLQDAVIRNLQVMAESSKRLSDKTRGKYHNIDWNKLIGFRNIVVHDYLGIELDRVWQIIEKDLPEFRAAIKQILED